MTGGLIGRIQDDCDINITNCYNIGQIDSVSDNVYYGGLVGNEVTNKDNNYFNKCYYVKGSSFYLANKDDGAGIGISASDHQSLCNLLNQNIEGQEDLVNWVCKDGIFPKPDIEFDRDSIEITGPVKAVEDKEPQEVRGNGKVEFTDLENKSNKNYVVKIIDAAKLNTNTKKWETIRDGVDFYSSDEENSITNVLALDLALRNSIVRIERGGKNITSQIFDKNKDSREPQIDIEGLKQGTTAYYTHPKDAVEVKQGDYITYKINVYNEGDIEGFANEIKVYLQPGLEFVKSDTLNLANEWVYDEKSNSVSTKILSNTKSKDNVIKPSEKKDSKDIEDKGKSINLKVKVANNNAEYLTCRAEITSCGYNNSDKKIDALDKDSTLNSIKDTLNLENWYESNIKSDKIIKTEKGKYYPGEQDDDDFETVSLGNIIVEQNLIFDYDNNTGKARLIGYNDEIKDKEELHIPQNVKKGNKTYSVTEIAENALSNGGFKNVYLPNTIETIGASAFNECASLEKINLPDSLKTIREGAFGGCVSLKNGGPITIPRNVSSMPIHAFSTFDVVLNIDGNNNTYSCDENGILYNKERTILYGATRRGDSDTFVVPEGVTEIKDSAFVFYGRLKEITIGRTVSIIGNSFNYDSLGEGEQLTIKGYKGTAAESYANTHDRIDFVDLDSYFRFGEDNYSFNNSDYYFEKEYYIGEDIFNLLKDTYREQYAAKQVAEDWHGSCVGMSISTIYFKNKILNPSYWQAGAEKEYDINFNINLSYMLNFYNLFQDDFKANSFNLEDISGPDISEYEGFLKGVQKAYERQSKQLLYCDFLWKGLDDKGQYGTVGHAVVITGKPEKLSEEFYERHNSEFRNYEYRIPIYDPNYYEQHYIYIRYDMQGVSVGSETNCDDYGLTSGSSSGNSDIYQIDAYSLGTPYNIEEKLNNNNKGTILEYEKTTADITTESSIAISNNQGATVSFEKGEINPKEGDLQCEVYPIICDNLESNGIITRNSISLEDEDWYSIETENDTDKLDAHMQFGDSYMRVLTQAGGKAEFENKKSVKLSNYSGQEYEMKLTLNNEFRTLPWYTITVDGTGTKEAKLEMVENGAIISGDDLKNITVKGNDSEETVELGISTDKDKVLITANNDETKLLAYIDTDGDGSFETLLEDGKENLNNNQNKTEEKTNQKENVTNAQTGDQIVLMVMTLLVAVIALACTVVIKRIIK